ncbi:GPI ethanolamine phosphate transferase 1 [Portunus trituberculatus]|uniref:GPI ethanolamine phosphate transferase 1 n=1 Tax=Portunus trituberculatus TaxID=210409 RepID=A0A5B7DSN4_PORTR|nr:GPI ethanolamine phosphate transferase 1 [Portunus trituberculatus]
MGCGGEGGGHRHIPGVMYLQGLMVVCTVYLVHSTAFSLSRKEGLPFINQLAAWTLLVLSLLLPLLGSHNMMGRLLSVSTSLFCPFLLLSIRHEGFFYIALTIAMYLWLILEFYLAENNVQIAMLKFATWCNEALIGKERVLEWSDVRQAAQPVGPCNRKGHDWRKPDKVSLAATGDRHSAPPLRLVTTLASVYTDSTSFLVPTRALFYVFLVMSDFMAVHFFFLIKTEGSWLDIGTSLSHYIISMATTLFLILLLFIAKFLTTFHIGKASTEGECVLPRVSVGRPHRD